MKTVQHRPSAAKVIITTWLIAGSLDIICVCIYYYIKTGKNPVNILYYVAGTVIGKTASPGVGTAAAGLLIHYCIALIWTIIFFIIYPRISSVFKSPFFTGFFYGIFIWVIMNVIIVPLIVTPKPKFLLINSMINMLILILAVGLPISIIIGKYYRKKKLLLT